MKPWCVVQYNARSVVDIRYGQERRGTEGFYYAGWDSRKGSVPFIDPMVDPHTRSVQVFFTDTEAEANRLMEELAEKNPGIEYATAQIGLVAVTPAAKPVLSKFTDKGLLPV